MQEPEFPSRSIYSLAGAAWSLLQVRDPWDLLVMHAPKGFADADLASLLLIP